MKALELAVQIAAAHETLAAAFKREPAILVRQGVTGNETPILGLMVREMDGRPEVILVVEPSA